MSDAAGTLLVDEPAPGIARLTISNPAKRNALDHPILDAITATLGELTARCVIVTGAHGMFSAGYDIGEIPEEEFLELCTGPHLDGHGVLRQWKRGKLHGVGQPAIKNTRGVWGIQWEPSP